MAFPNSFSAKILLFGEYTIINGGSALALPFEKYSGAWTMSKSTTDLDGFFSFLSDQKGVLQEKIKQAQLENWIFESTIPLGYGLGSSGALAAAAYSSFFTGGDLSLNALQEKLASIESFFHGKSSGLDPLASYLKKPIRVKKNKVEILEKLKLPPELYLYDSGADRISKPLIKDFKIKVDTDPMFQKAMSRLSVFNDSIIEELVAGKDITASFKEISLLQYEFFDNMIPPAVKHLWKNGLDNDSYYFKLSGAGGGGFFLVLSNREKLNLANTLPLG